MYVWKWNIGDDKTVSVECCVSVISLLGQM